MESGTESPVRCSICMEYRSSDVARMVPCGHEFDLACTSRLLKSSGIVGRNCPLCRSRIEEIHYNFEDGTHEKHITGPVRAESPLMSGPFIRPDEELRTDMAPAERDRVLELRRLRQGGGCRIRMCLAKRGIHTKEGDNFIVMHSCIDVRIDQVPHDAGTASTMVRKFVIATLPIDAESEAYVHRFGPLNPAGIAQARDNVKILLARVGCFEQDFARFHKNGLLYKILYDDKGLRINVRKTLQIVKDDNGGEDILIVSTLKMNEIYATRPPAADPDKLYGIERSKREQVVRLAREEFEGALEFAFIQNPTIILSEPTATGILDVRPGIHCEHCDLGGHRNGDCELNKIRKIFADHGELGEDDEF
ncbi:uncharacterized protein LY89DRAFT_714863 [Mollisia scopiformis]|uniref:RING-type domain-containing protein n=1 Tax=Mollisia scopiformis TaxID=149040 RepID=A0A194XNU0_MOLSC|nr:uncharacterized protein LY89DRAFT_714863 [Mollisia scopiformis]KUJ21826.1 hypothetical protein LY89DRAFT_714863 [Mollisia scopiformis]